MVISAPDAVIANTNLDSIVPHESSNTKLSQTGHFTHYCFKKDTPLYKDKPHLAQGVTTDPNDNISHSSSSDNSDQESTSSHDVNKCCT